jgi:hypothetical protein
LGDVKQRQDIFEVNRSHRGESHPEQKIERGLVMPDPIPQKIVMKLDSHFKAWNLLPCKA